MISKCANPQCAKTLMRLDGGRFFGFHTKDPHIKHKKIENFWLCANCAKSFTLPSEQPGYRHVWHLYVIECKDAAKRDEFLKFV